MAPRLTVDKRFASVRNFPEPMYRVCARGVKHDEQAEISFD
jgi:hypothetical protein